METLLSRLKTQIISEVSITEENWQDKNCGARKLATAMDTAINAYLHDYLEDYLKKYIAKLEVNIMFAPPDSTATTVVGGGPVTGMAKGTIAEKLL